MITYVNTVLVSNNASAAVKKTANLTAATEAAIAALKGNFVIQNQDGKDLSDLDTITGNEEIRIGMILGTATPVAKKDGSISYQANVKWSNAIRLHDIKAVHEMAYNDWKPKIGEDKIVIDFTKMTAAMATKMAEGNKHIFLRLTFKDLPTRYRNWTETYDYLTNAGDTATEIAKALAYDINKQIKRARVKATAAAGVLTLEALPYDDDNAADTINVANKVRFNANAYFKDIDAPAFASSNRYEIAGVTFTKTEGVAYPAAGKLVRDRENGALGYEGILNRGMCTWPIIKPATEAVNSTNYDAITLEFENMYRAADDIFRKTKQTVEIYAPTAGITAIKSELAKVNVAPVKSNVKAAASASTQG